MSSRGELPKTLKAALEQRLGRHLVRSLWRGEIANGVPRRNAVRAPVAVPEHDEERAQAMLALETAFVHLEARWWTHSRDSPPRDALLVLRRDPWGRRAKQAAQSSVRAAPFEFGQVPSGSR